mgnify:CR=1 FL=1
MDKEKKKQIIKMCVAVVVFAIILLLVAIVMIRYQVEGDKNMPFNLSKIILISTAEGTETEGDKKWNFTVYQNNDVYLYFDKNEEYWGEEKNIESVKIENIQISTAPTKGEVKVYMPNSVDGRLYSYDEEYLVNGSLEYKGAAESNSRTLEIGSNGGSALIRFSNTGLGEYSSDSDEEIVHDGSLLNKIEVGLDEIKFAVSFDLVIAVDNCSYRANITLDMPSGDIISEGTCSLEKTDMSDVVFLRE